MTNTLYYGDNLDILRRYIPDEAVDLIYLDPPFNSKATYNVLFGEQNGSKAAAQIKAFEDTWTWDQAAAQAYQQVVEAGGKVSQAMQAFRMFLGDSNMLAYLAMMAPRLVELRRVLKPTGSIYLHCDPTASHYLKMLMDAVFGVANFRNEIVWRRGHINTHTTSAQFPHNQDVLLLYSKSPRGMTYMRLFKPYSAATLKMYRYDDNDGRGPYRLQSLRTYGQETIARMRQVGRIVDTHSGVAFKQYFSDKPGVVMDGVWEDIPSLQGNPKERLGYPTQKPEALLERIIRASSNEGDLVLDPFCGCGTTIAVAQRLNRRWIGIDITHLAVGLMKHRLRDAFGDQAVYQVIGEPVSLPDAQALAASDPYQFQWWALGLVGARPVEQKKGSDKGIDGRIYFHDEADAFGVADATGVGEGGKTKQVILSVKAGHANVTHLRDLRGVVEREKAEIGVLLTMQEPTQPMRTEVAGAGFYHSPGWNKDYARLQILTVAELLTGKGIDMPPLRQVNRTFKRAPRARHGPSEKQGELL
jgi:DNA modification methylase